MTISLQINGRWTHEDTMGITFLRGMGTSSQFLAFFKMAPTLTCRYYAPINVKSQDGGGGGGGSGKG